MNTDGRRLREGHRREAVLEGRLGRCARGVAPAPAAGRRSRCRPRSAPRRPATGRPSARAPARRRPGRRPTRCRRRVTGWWGRPPPAPARRPAAGSAARRSAARCRLGRRLAGSVIVLARVRRRSSTARRRVPLRTRSVSPRSPTGRPGPCPAPSYQTRAVCDPASSDIGEIEVPPMSGSAGRPSRAVSTTVPDSGGPRRLRHVDEQLRGGPLRQHGGGAAPAVIDRATADRADDDQRGRPGTAQTQRGAGTSELSVLRHVAATACACRWATLRAVTARSGQRAAD